jgi:hypothetical protein
LVTTFKPNTSAALGLQMQILSDPRKLVFAESIAEPKARSPDAKTISPRRSTPQKG